MLASKLTTGEVILSLILLGKIHSSVALAPGLLGDVVNDDDDEGSYAFRATNGYPKFDVGCVKSKAC